MIPTLNEEVHIADVISQIVEGDPIAATCPIIVADGGSTDQTREIVLGLTERYPNLRLVPNPGRAQSAALNLALGSEFAEFDVLIRCDAHSAYPSNYVSRLVTTLEATGGDSVVVPMDARAGKGCFQRGLAWVADTKLGAGGSLHRGGTRSEWVDHGHHAAFRMEMFRALGGYDVSFLTNEDAEYDYRVVSAGGKIWLESGIRIGYFPRRSPKALFRQYYRYGRGRAKNCWKHRVRPAARQMIPVLHTVALALSLPLAPLGLAYPVVYLAGVGIAGTLIAVQHRSVCGLAAAPALAIMHTSWGIGFLVETLSRKPRRKDMVGLA